MLMGIQYYASKGEMMKLVEDLSRLIEQMMALEREEVFAPLEEDITSKLQVQVQRLGDILSAQSRRNLASKRELESLIADIAHQLKTPLTNIGLYTQLLQDQSLDETSYQTFYGGLHTEVEKLTFLVDTLIKMSRLESGVIKICEENGVIQETCLKAIKAVYLKAKQKQITLLFEGGEELMTVHDPKWTAEALTNILDNAIKYSTAGTEVSISIVPYEFFVRIDVKDQGIGIEETEYTQIFKRFYRGKASSQIEGAGIGLYLTRKIVEMQKGYVKVKSEQGKGALFTLMLPRDSKKSR